MDSETSALVNIPKFKVALCQLRVTEDKEMNIANARRSIEDSADKGAKLVILPEMWNCSYSSESFPKYAENIDDYDQSPSTLMLSEVARQRSITIIGGSIAETSSNRLYNTCCVFAPNGTLIAKHRKLHLFDVDIPGDILFRESDALSAGYEPTLIESEDVGCIGIGICHDIRFPELAMLYKSRGAHLICYPGAFNLSTGELLWELMQRARAADNQLFVATCSPSRDSKGDYAIWGHSSLVGPFGEIIATSGTEEATIIAEIDYSQIHLRRSNLPLETQRRGDIYKLVDVLTGKGG